jgi:hypothetical protein
MKLKIQLYQRRILHLNLNNCDVIVRNIALKRLCEFYLQHLIYKLDTTQPIG